MNLMSSTLLVEDTGVPFDELQAEQIARYRGGLGGSRLGARAAHLGEPERPADRLRPRPAVLRRSRVEDAVDQVGYLEGTLSRFGKSYIGEPDAIAAELSQRRGRPRGGHAPAHRPEPARRRLQREAPRDLRAPHRAGDRLTARRSTRPRGLGVFRLYLTPPLAFSESRALQGVCCCQEAPRCSFVPPSSHFCRIFRALQRRSEALSDTAVCG